MAPARPPFAVLVATLAESPDRTCGAALAWTRDYHDLTLVKGQEAQRLVASLAEQDLSRLKKKKQLMLSIQVEHVDGKLWKITGIG